MKKMGPGMRKDNKMSRGGSEFFILSIVFFLLNISSFFVAPVSGYALKMCRVKQNVALCTGISPKLTAVPRDIPSSVKGYDLSGNSIKKIQVSDFQNLKHLLELDLSYNDILEMEPGAFVDLISLKKINLNNNKITKLGEHLFNGLTNLTELRIHKNRIRTVAPTAFKSMTSLKLLEISNNKLHSLTRVHAIIQHLPSLRVLSIKSNDVTSFHSWELTNSSLGLTSLDLSQHSMAVFRITADIFPNLTQLIIGGSHTKKSMILDVQNKTFLRRVQLLDIGGIHMTFDDMKSLLKTVNSSLTYLRMDAMKGSIAAQINISCIIPTLSKLQLRKNRLRFIRLDLFQLCINLTELDLSWNQIVNIQEGAFRSTQGLKILSLSHNKLPSVPAELRNLPILGELDLSSNNISTLKCQDFANMTRLRKLYIYSNKISVLEGCFFKDLIHLQVLKLQNNTISRLNDAFKVPLPSLTQLRLNSNPLTILKKGVFQGLHMLQNLSLHENQITELKKGCFSGLPSITDLYLQSNKIETDSISQGVLHDLWNLRRLDLRNNRIRYYNNSALPQPPFANLSNLQSFNFLVQRRRGRSQLPPNILQGLTSLLYLNMRNIQLLSVPKDMFSYTPQLKTLDISSNELRELSSDVFRPIQQLELLYITRANLRTLDFLIDTNLTKLRFIEARVNPFSVISEDVVKSLPALTFFDVADNTFTCDCNNAWFSKWAKDNVQTQVLGAYNFECNFPPELKHSKLLDFDVQSCQVNIDYICFISTTCTILLFMVVSFTYHFLRWQLTYAYYFFLALLVNAKSKNKQTPNQYDAFISYNTHDELWVIKELLPKLEEEQGWRLCLHHRDFEPGKDIIDNITDAIYGSRKTICVISRKYLESEWCSREIQVASFRLFDEQRDVLILVFLEEIPIWQLSPYYRMRKLMKKKTYLSWQQAGDHTNLFWEKLRQALTTGEEPGEERFLLNVMNR